MRLLAIAMGCLLAVSLVIACGGGPSDEEVEAKGYEIAGRAIPLMMEAGFSSDPECQDIFNRFESDLDLDEDAADQMSNREIMSELKKAEKQLDDFEDELREAQCVNGN